ncbi:MAG TPA: hypothetical protein VJM12_22280 [Pyrinomonadaceae bacterium]|nr:hypothetical protein [Pyrinomonadaceae bacterium]
MPKRTLEFAVRPRGNTVGRLPLPIWLLDQESRALLARLARVKPFALLEPMLPAAAVSPSAQTAIDNFLASGRRELRSRIRNFMKWLRSPAGLEATPEEAQSNFTIIRMRFNDVLSQFDLFADVLTQRSEHETGVWLSGLDVVATDALKLPGYYEPPPVVCYLDRGPGAAIRRARTRLPGGKQNPVAVVRVPRERMVGSGIASSLVHEVGHQAAALLDLVNSLRPTLQGLTRSGIAWSFWDRWISEIVADFWSVARVGIASTLGLMAVVSLPRAFVFRINEDDPHPTPWLRVKLSCAIGKALYPHAQWDRLARLWEAYYPTTGLEPAIRTLFATLEAGIPSFVTLLTHHRPKLLRGAALHEVVATEDRQPARLSAYFSAWKNSPRLMRSAPPSLSFAVLGQARAEGRLSPELESRMLAYLLTYWALRSTLDISASYARPTACQCACRQ